MSYIVILMRVSKPSPLQYRSQSMPVRGLGVGIALAKPNEICNFIGCREINETDIGSKQYKRGISAGIMRGNAITM